MKPVEEVKEGVDKELFDTDTLPNRHFVLNQGETITPLPDTKLQYGHVRYSGTKYIGDVSEDHVIEGATDDVIKVLEALHKLK